MIDVNIRIAILKTAHNKAYAKPFNVSDPTVLYEAISSLKREKETGIFQPCRHNVSVLVSTYSNNLISVPSARRIFEGNDVGLKVKTYIATFLEMDSWDAVETDKHLLHNVDADDFRNASFCSRRVSSIKSDIKPGDVLKICYGPNHLTCVRLDNRKYRILNVKNSHLLKEGGIISDLCLMLDVPLKFTYFDTTTNEKFEYISSNKHVVTSVEITGHNDGYFLE